MQRDPLRKLVEYIARGPLSKFRDEDDAERLFKNYAWSKMLAKVFKIDVTTCDHCGGKMRTVCAVRDPDSIARYLKSQQIDHIPPARGPPRVEWREFDCVDESVNADPCSDEQAPHTEIEPIIHCE